MNIPTQEQVKEFWEWCGFKKVDNPTVYCKWAYCYPDGNLYSFKGFPPIDLNNLFKWAVPGAIQEMLGELSYDRRSAVRALFKEWLNNNPNGTDDFALALFWAIWKVIKGAK